MFSLSARQPTAVLLAVTTFREVIRQERLGTHGGVIKGINVAVSAKAPTALLPLAVPAPVESLL